MVNKTDHTWLAGAGPQDAGLDKVIPEPTSRTGLLRQFPFGAFNKFATGVTRLISAIITASTISHNTCQYLETGS